jgi:UDP-N-acetylglucosamine:LPS N-acetylglucosamine transferase
MNSLIKKGRKIKAVYIGPRIGIQKEWLIEKEGVSAKKYFEILSSSDLVFMHQGMVTLAQAISCQIPVICNVSILKTEIPRLHFWEVLPFKRAGVCEMFSKTTKIEKIEKGIEELLYDEKEIEKMRKKQKEIFERGEERFFKELKKICAN